MSRSTYSTVQEADRTLDVLTQESAGFRLTISRLGAEPVSLARRDSAGQWRGFLWRDGELSKPAKGWGNHATVMGYYLHRLKEEQSRYRGREIHGGTHSFLRHKTFPEPQVETFPGGGAALTYTMEPGMYEAHEYPFRVRLRLTYHLEPGDAGTLRVRFHFQNREPRFSTHVSFGLHPGFAVGSLADCAVLLPAGRYVRHLAPGNFLSGETVTIEHAGGPMPFAKRDLPGSFLLDLAAIPPAERVFELHDPAGGRRVAVDCAQAPFLTLWSDGNDFVCIEPCWGLPDHARQRPFEEKLGIQEIPASGELVREFAIRAELAG